MSKAGKAAAPGNSLNEIRAGFLDYFAGRGHTVVPSAPLVPRNDPTLLFTNAGMVPFKNLFTGAERRDYTRAASSQKCVRAGGKHNDLDNVGYTARHHTFFEMLGNFSFGDYFKDEAIKLAWDLVTRDFGLDARRLTITVYGEDDEAFSLWRKIAGLPEERVLRIATSDNFWAMGDTGPCGPCSEIFYDHGAHIPGGPPGSPDQDGDRFVEIWNLVFMQFDQQADGSRTPLPKPSIDTGMGLERIGAVLQGTHDNYQTDLFRTLIAAAEDLVAKKAQGADAPSFRVIADHLRASSFLVADGVQPSNEGRGYVLRRIMRRAMRHAHLLGAERPLMHRLVPVLVGEMGEAYPELVRAEAAIRDTLRLEETRFRETLARGLKLLEEETAHLAKGDVLSGAVAFKLYDTFGFPYDLTEDALRARGIGVDRAGFDAAMGEQKQTARAAWAGSGEAAEDSVWFNLREAHGASEFVGDGCDTAEAEVQAIVVDGKIVPEIKRGEAGAVIVGRTPFYAEGGGQVGDIGVIASSAGGQFVVTDTQKRAGALHVHIGRLEAGKLKTGDKVRLTIDAARRTAIRANHSATHLLHAALRQVLGAHVTQKGSLVAPDRLRFDFSHGQALTTEELLEIEDLVNLMIRRNEEVGVRRMGYDAALEAGAIALFGEKYGDEVRVLSMGSADDDRSFSVELCGGTHVRRTGDIQLLKIVSEGAIGGGVRRIEALTGPGAISYLRETEQALKAAAGTLKAPVAELPERIAALLAERRTLERQLADLKKKVALGGGGNGAAPAHIDEIAGVKLIAAKLDGVAAKDLRGLIDDAKKKLGSGIVAYVAVADDKAAMAVGVTEDLTGRVSAVDLVRAGAAALGGKGGGGRPDFAQAGGPDAAGAEAALAAVRACVAAAG